MYSNEDFVSAAKTPTEQTECKHNGNSSAGTKSIKNEGNIFKAVDAH